MHIYRQHGKLGQYYMDLRIPTHLYTRIFCGARQLSGRPIRFKYLSTTDYKEFDGFHSRYS